MKTYLFHIDKNTIGLGFKSGSHLFCGEEIDSESIIFSEDRSIGLCIKKIPEIEFHSLDNLPSTFDCKGLNQKLAALWPILSFSRSEISHHEFFKELAEAEHIVFFGGSFNPLHDGHRECIRQVNQRPLVIIPDMNPFKDIDKERDYFKLYRSLANEFESDDVFVYPGFCGLSEANPTYNWVKELNQKCSLIIGDDSFLSLHKWFEFDSLVQALFGLYVIPRQADDEEYNKQCERILEVNPDIEIRRLKHHQFEHLSSTDIRNKS